MNRPTLLAELVTERYAAPRLPLVRHSPVQARTGTVTPWTAPDPEVIERRQRVLCGDEPEDVEPTPAEQAHGDDELAEDVPGG